jgi:hypothetical protein
MRDAERKEFERIRAENAYIRQAPELDHLPPRRTSESDEAGTEGRWDETYGAWQRANSWRPSGLPRDDGYPSSTTAGAASGKLLTLTRLIKEAERSGGRFKPLSLRPNHGHEDHESPGELWWRENGHHKTAAPEPITQERRERLADPPGEQEEEQEAARASERCLPVQERMRRERLHAPSIRKAERERAWASKQANSHRDSGTLWDGLTPSPACHILRRAGKRIELATEELTREQQGLEALMQQWPGR